MGFVALRLLASSNTVPRNASMRGHLPELRRILLLLLCSGPKGWDRKGVARPYGIGRIAERDLLAVIRDIWGSWPFCCWMGSDHGWALDGR